MPRNWQLQLRRDTAANWTSANPTLAAGEVGYETDTGKLKIGDGATAWSGLAYFSGAGGGITTLASPGSTIGITNPTGPTADIDLPASGVSAGTYGDATHSSRVTVNAEGIVTALSQVAIGGISGTGLVTLYDSGFIGASVASIDTGAGAIAAGHGALLISYYARGDRAAVNDVGLMRFNNDSGATQYTFRKFLLSNTTVSGQGQSQSSFETLWTAASAASNIFGGGIVLVLGYDSGAFPVLFSWYHGEADVGASSFMAISGGWYNSTTQISRVSIAPSAGNLIAKSRLLIQGTM